MKLEPGDPAAGQPAELRIEGDMSRLRPEDVADAVVRALAPRAAPWGDRMVIPHLLQLFVCPELDAALGTRREALRSAAAQAIGRAARSAGHELLDAPSVEWTVLGLQARGTIALHPSFGRRPPSGEAPTPDLGERTAAMPVLPGRSTDGPDRPAPSSPEDLPLRFAPSGLAARGRRDGPPSTHRLPAVGPTDPLAVSELGAEPGSLEDRGAIWGLLVDAVGRRFPLRGIVLVGRSPAADLVLTEATVSSRHARLFAQADGRGVVSDLGSLNGTAVNGKAIVGAQELRPGDIVSFGTLRLKFEQLGT